MKQCRILLRKGCKVGFEGEGERGVRVRFNGDIEGLSDLKLKEEVKEIERISNERSGRGGEGGGGMEALDVWVLLNYSGREAIRRFGGLGGEEEERSATFHSGSSVMPFSIDLIVRSAAEFRLSDFCLYESSYAEFFTVDKLWPDVEREDFRSVREQWGGRRRRMGS